MSIEVKRDSKLVKVLAAQARGQRVDSAQTEEAAQIINDLASDMRPENRYQIAQTMAFTLNELQKNELDFLNRVADIKNINYGDKAAFNLKTGGIKAVIQAKGSTTPRSYVAGRQVNVETEEVSARPAINIVDLRAGRVNMAELIRDANREMTNKKLQKIEAVLQNAIDDYSDPFYGTGTGIVQGTIDNQIAYFRRLGPVTLLGDSAAVTQLVPMTGIAMSNGDYMQRSNEMLNEYNENGFLAKYKGADVLQLANTYFDGTTTPVLATNWIYILPAGMSGDARNLKVVNEGGVNAIEAQNIDDVTYEVRLDQWFGAAFISGKLPTIGAYKIN